MEPSDNPFVTPVSQLDRVRNAQVCPYCFAQAFTAWGADLRENGKCTQCGKKSYLYRGVLHSKRDAIILGSAGVSITTALIIWFTLHYCA